MAPTAGMLRYNTDNKYQERSTDGGATWTQLDLTGATLLSYPRSIPATASISGTTNNYSIPNARYTLLRLNPTASATITGVTMTGTPQDGDVLEINNTGVTFPILLPYNSSSSASGSRFINFAASVETYIGQRGFAKYIYQSANGWWWLAHHESADYQAATTATFTVNGGGTLTLAAATNYFKIVGRELHWQFAFNLTLVSGTVTSVDIHLPTAVMTATKVQYIFAAVTSAAAGSIIGRLTVLGSGSSLVRFEVYSAAGLVNYGAGANVFLGTVVFEID